MKLKLLAIALLAGATPAIADTIDYGQFGANGAFLSSPVTGTTTDGVSFTLVGPAGFQRADQDSSWLGQFPSGNKLLYSDGPGQLVIYFASAISSLTDFGVEVDAPGSYTSTANAYFMGGLVASVVRPGLSAPGGPGLLFTSSLFAPAFDTVTISSTNDGSGFAIGSTAIAVTPGVPEPATWALLIGGFAAVGVAARRRATVAVMAA